jgi:diguanylate cyclase (GGDEF)-like protein
MMVFCFKLNKTTVSMKQSYFYKLKLSIKVLLLCLCNVVLASSFDQWQAVELNVDDGLPDSTVYSMVQDKTGYMWFGTTSGLARFDGYTFKVFRHDGADSNTLSNNNAGNIYLDSQNQIWVGTFGGGANVFNLSNGKINRLPYSSTVPEKMIAENVQTFLEDSRGYMWVGTANGLYRLKDDQLQYYGHNADNSKSIGNERIWDIEEDKKGHLWVATSHGLSQFNNATGEFNQFNLPEELVVNISSHQFRTLLIVGDVLWIGTSTGLYGFDMVLNQFKQYPTHFKTFKVNDILYDNDGLLWLASMEGLIQFDLAAQSFVTNSEGQLWQAYSHLDIRQIYRDRSDLLWLATRDNGVVKIDQAGGVFRLHDEYIADREQLEKSKQVWDVQSNGKGELILGTSEAVYRQTNEGNFEPITANGHQLEHGIIRTISKRSSGGFWVGASNGLYYLPADSNQIETKNEPFDLVGIEPTDVFSVSESSDGELWLALYNLGVMRWNPETQNAELIQSLGGHSLVDLNISVILLDSQQNIWIGSYLVGIIKYLPEHQEIRVYEHEFGESNSLSSNRVKDIFEDHNGQIWIGTARGLNKFIADSNHFIQLTQSSGLFDDNIQAISEDSEHNLWIAYKFGLGKLKSGSREINSYVLNEAVGNNGINARSMSINLDDVIYLGSGKGYYSFDPKTLKSDSLYQPKLMLTQVWINNQSITYLPASVSDAHFDLYQGDQSIAFEIAALDFKSPEQIKYRYRILGLKDDWLNINSNRLIELNDLSPNDYHLEIKALNNDGRWSEQLLSIHIKVHPVWWNLAWVQALIAVFIVVLAYAFHTYRTHKIRTLNLQLELEVKNRTSELSHLNNQLKTAAHSDFLTKVPNRMSFIQSFEKTVSHNQKTSINGCIVMADVDYFKLINDRYGHAIGDKVLVEVSALLNDMVREDDLMARWGGEEFIFFFSGKNAAKILSLVERIREAVETHQFNFDGQNIPVTITFGLCEFKQGMSLNECINAADEAMYVGKAEGRNAVKVAKI